MSIKMNRDQVFSLTNHVIGIMGTLLAANGSMSDDLQQQILGALTAVASTGISVWFNYGNLLDQVSSATRKVLVIIGTYAAAQGWITGDQVQAWSGPIMVAATLFWSQFFYRDEPGPDLPGTTIR
jgi:hypothetical protein